MMGYGGKAKLPRFDVPILQCQDIQFKHNYFKNNQKLNIGVIADLADYEK